IVSNVRIQCEESFRFGYYANWTMFLYNDLILFFFEQNFHCIPFVDPVCVQPDLRVRTAGELNIEGVCTGRSTREGRIRNSNRFFLRWSQMQESITGLSNQWLFFNPAQARSVEVI